jgi:hypothetical protein
VRISESARRLLPGRAPALVAVVSTLALLAAPAGTPAGAGAGAPTPSSAPAVAGPPTQGARLVGSPGRWISTGKIAYAYQWYRCDTMGAHCAVLHGVTQRRRVVGRADVGHTLSLAVRATDSGGSTTAYASLVGPVAGKPAALALKALPWVSGDSVLGATVRIDPGRWVPKPSGFSFQWARCNAQGRACAPIAGATDDTHEIATADLGHPLVAIVQARSHAAARAVFSVATPVTVAERGAAGPSSTAVPMVATVVQQGRKLVGAAGTWSGSGPVHYTYQWYRCDPAGAHCAGIRGATATSYTPGPKDVGKTLGFTVRARDAVGASTAYANLIGPIAGVVAALASAGQPTVTGVPTQGQTLLVSSGGWTQTPGAVAYQWQRCNANGRLCAPIPGATAPSYVSTADDVGHVLLAVVHASGAGGAQDALSTATRPIAVAPGPSSAALPVVTGTIQERARLTGSPGTWAGSGAISFCYQWYRCDPTGAHCRSIHGATKATYTQSARDVGQTLGLAVRATDTTGTSTAYSPLAGIVAGSGATLVATAQPTIAGTPQQGQKLEVGGGSWSQTPTAFSYQWQRCNANGRLCAPIPDAHDAAYTATAADAGHRLVVLVQAVANGVPQATLSTVTGVIS